MSDLSIKLFTAMTFVGVSALFMLASIGVVVSEPPYPCYKAQMPNVDDPYSFYKCDAGGNPHLWHCPAGTMYDRKTEICDWERDVIARYGKPKENGRSNEGAESSSKNGNGKSKRTPGPLDDDYDNGENWEEYLKWREQFRGSKTRRDGENARNNNMDCSSTSTNTLPKLYQNTDDCSTFYTCNMGRPVLTYCPRGLRYNPGRQGCDDSYPNGCQYVRGSQEPSDVRIYERRRRRTSS